MSSPSPDPSIIDLVLNGIIPANSNPALLALTEILGTGLIPSVTTTDAPAVTMLTMLSSSLNPIYIGLLFIILGYIAVGGTAQTAMHGRFLGEWRAPNTIGMFMLCVVLLSPIPGAGSSTFGQVLFIKGVTFGSNMADFALKKVFENAVLNNPEQVQVVGERFTQVSDNLKLAVPMYYCAMQLTHMGYGTRRDFFRIVNNICGIPTDAFGMNMGPLGTQSGTNRLISYYLLSNETHINNINAERNALNSELGSNIMPAQRFSVDNIETRINEQTSSTRELMCYFDAIHNNMSKEPISIEVARAMNISQVRALGPITGFTNTNQKPDQLNNRSLDKSKDSIKGAWAATVNQTYQCLHQLQQPQQDPQAPPQPPPDGPWRKGWSYAALAISDSLASYANQVQNANMRLNQTIFKSPDLSAFPSTLLDQNNKQIMHDNLAILVPILNDPVIGNLVSGMTAAASANGMNTDGSFLVNAADIVSIAAGAGLAAGMNTYRYARVSTRLGARSPNAPAIQFMNSTIGRVATGPAVYIGRKVGHTTALAAKFFFKINNLNDVMVRAMSMAREATGAFSSIPGASIIAAGINKAKIAVMPSPTNMMILGIILILINAVILLPQVVLLVVLLIWLAKVAVWYLIIPIATVIIAIPNTRAGHDVWKSALSIILLPILALFFYLVSLFLSDVMYLYIIEWTFAPIILQESFLAGVGGLIMSILTGEIFFRMFIGVGVIIAATFYMALMIIKGPDLVTGSFGLSGNSGDLGGEFENLRGKLAPPIAGVSR